MHTICYRLLGHHYVFNFSGHKETARRQFLIGAGSTDAEEGGIFYKGEMTIEAGNEL